MAAPGPAGAPVAPGVAPVAPGVAPVAPGVAPVAPGAAPVAPAPLFGGCLSCRWLSGTALLLAAAWIYSGPRASMKRGIPPSMGTIAQITFAIGVGAWGAVILVDPVGKQLRKEP